MGGGDPTTTGRYVVVTTLEGSGREIGLVQTAALDLTIYSTEGSRATEYSSELSTAEQR